MTFDGKVFGAEIVAIVKGHVERSLAPLNARIEAMEKMIAAWPVPKDGEPGKSITLDDVAPMIKGEVDRLAAQLPDIGAMVREAVDKIPEGIDGKDADPELIKQMVADAVAALPPAEKGKDADPVEVAAQIMAEVERAVAALPVPKDGQSVTLDDVRPLIEEAVTKAVTLIPVPKDGVDGKDGRDGLDVVKFIRDDRGHLNGILRDGTTVDLGEYVGKDGAPGKDGADGVGFDDMSVVFDGERGFKFRFVKGSQVKEFAFTAPWMIYRGVFRSGESYKEGDVCTWGGNIYHCHTDTTDKPDGEQRCWTLAVKKGRDGKDGIIKPAREITPVKVD
ncbi:hypothetical protein EFV37_29205 [Mesorhizobium loti]|uniref:Uncharacterized protein n=1 Tax=Mesorhizobium jarvisii TaxID=1777867 RepID=A0A6M7TMA7_9HYPH|nr:MULTISPECIES: hypothetical protein [Mesorhizobium]OBQ68917.1 hypothetical protein A9K72_12055 [Mesorhizobium loti]QKC65882.1 hypothetical protein EB229_29195 [Mesorhizobium jarvisii]QKD11796.1 hypothetical protein EFV37_29205 [Mesorhizobium loti]RJT37902.1 hypothetical protein D3242_01250 [Mesorhizobium jarvisii]